jgi:hydroxymethylglutaryl-CoA lyase
MSCRSAPCARPLFVTPQKAIAHKVRSYINPELAMTSSDHVRIVEVGARDGLQNEKTLLPATVKIELIDRLSDTGLQTIEATSFVSPQWVPQLADAAEVFGGIRKKPGVSYPVLVPNMQGYQRALAAGATDVAVFTAASEAFNRRNINASIDESIERFAPVLEQARVDGVSVRGYVSTVLGCPYQGDVPVSDVVRVAQRLHRMGCHEISLGDTIGVGTPTKARAMLRAVAGEVPMAALAVHFHDTYGQALANILACLEEGVRVVDSAVSGTGGCPYAKGATGNVASEDVVYMLHGMGLETGIDLDLLINTGAWLATQLHKETASRVTRARTAAA